MSFPVLLCWLALIGIAASLLQNLANRLTVPHSVLLAALGIALGALSAHTGLRFGVGALDEATTTLASLDIGSQRILYLFLPILLFGAALTIDVRRMIDDLAPILLLAIVAVVLCTLAVGFSLSLVAQPPLVACLLLGAIIATTDPVAVIGVFRDLGAPRRLSILVEGESLFNDAAAIALFTVLVDLLVSGRPLELTESAKLFALSFAGGAAIGFLVAHLALALLRPVRDLPAAEISITLALAYLSFVVAEHYLDVSGVVAVVVAGLVVGSQGRGRLSPQSWDRLDKVWAQLGYWASALIFIFASMLVPRFLTTVSFLDVALLLVLLVAATAARAGVLYGLLPMLAAVRLAQRVSAAYKAVILWGGLRGAVTLALALAITEDPAIPETIQRFVAVLATGFVLFTLLINATTLRPVMRLLGLDQLAPRDRVLRSRAIDLAMVRVADRIGEIAAHHHLAEAVRDDVMQSYPLPLRAAAGRDREPLPEDEQLAIGLITLTNREEELYRSHLADGTISRQAFAPLLAKAGRLRDAASTRGRDGYLATAHGALAFGAGFRVASLLHRFLRIHWPIARKLAIRFETLLTTRIVLEELQGFLTGKLAPLLGPEVESRLGALLLRRIDDCSGALAALQMQYPDYASALARHFLRQAALRTEDAEYRTLLEEQLISRELFNHLIRRVAGERAELRQRPLFDLGLHARTLIRGVPLFEALPDDGVDELARILKPRLAYPGERLMTKGERGDFMLFISSGTLEVTVDGQRHRLGRGDFVGELSLLTLRRRAATVTATAYCHLLELPGREFRRFLRTHADIRDHVRSVARERLNALEGPSGTPTRGRDGLATVPDAPAQPDQ